MSEEGGQTQSVVNVDELVANGQTTVIEDSEDSAAPPRRGIDRSIVNDVLLRSFVGSFVVVVIVVVVVVVVVVVWWWRRCVEAIQCSAVDIRSTHT